MLMAKSHAIVIRLDTRLFALLGHGFPKSRPSGLDGCTLLSRARRAGQMRCECTQTALSRVWS